MGVKKLENEVRNEIFRQMSLTSTLALDVPVRPMDAKELKGGWYADIPVHLMVQPLGGMPTYQKAFLR